MPAAGLVGRVARLPGRVARLPGGFLLRPLGSPVKPENDRREERRDAGPVIPVRRGGVPSCVGKTADAHASPLVAKDSFGHGVGDQHT